MSDQMKDNPKAAACALREEADLAPADLKYDKNGLLVAVIQDDADGEVLMVAYMNEESLERTLATRRTWFYSRSRQRYWMKGEESGNVQEVISVRYDCDGDALLIRVNQLAAGGGEGVACHTGRRTCFYRELGLGAVAADDATSGEAPTTGEGE